MKTGRIRKGRDRRTHIEGMTRLLRLAMCAEGCKAHDGALIYECARCYGIYCRLHAIRPHPCWVAGAKRPKSMVPFHERTS